MKEGWTYKPLGEVATFVKDGDWIESKDQSQSGIRLIQTGNIGSGVFRLKDDKPHYISEETMSKLGCTEIFEGDCLVSRLPNPVGRACLIPDIGCRMITAVDCSIIRFGVDYLPKLFVYFTQSSKYLNSIDDKTTGTTRKRISRKNLEKIQIPVLPPAEQERIVERLDAAFAQIDELKSNAEKQLAEARALFQSALTQAMQPKPGWQETTIGDICEIERGKRFVRADIVDDGVPCIHYGDIYTYYGLSVTKTKGCLKPELAKKMRFAKKNDVVVVQAGENNWDIGVGVAYFGEEPAAVHDACFILRHKQDPMFISYYLRSYNYHWYLLDYVHEGKICSFLKPALEKAPIPLPPLSEQQSIVATLDSLKSKVDSLQENLTKISQECDALKQALLRQIFE